MTWKSTVSLAALAMVVAGCSHSPAKPSATHLGVEAVLPDGQIPPVLQIAPVLPKPQPGARPETYSVVVNNVRAQDLLFALARDARLNVDVHPGITGSVTLNAIDQTLPQLLARISKQVDMRYELDGPNLLVMRDSPFLRTYKVDFVSASRNVKMQSQSSTQFGATGAAGAASASGATGSTATIDVASTNQLWESLVQNVKDILQETDKTLPAGTVQAAAPAAAAPGGAQQAAAAPSASYREAASVIGNRESGVLFIRATSRQHEKIQEFLDSVFANVRRQVLIEATIAEVQLNNEYQRGIDWQRLRTGALTTGRAGFGSGNSGIEFNQISTGTPAAIGTNAFVIGGAANSLNLSAAIRLLESFGDVRVLSSPKVSVLNNQTALLRVTRDIVYFTITPAQVTVSGTGGGTINIPPSFTTTPNIAAEGFMMSVLPQINDVDAVMLNVRPTIRRRVAFASDPNPALAAAGTSNDIPVFETREMDSILRIQSGQTAVLGGLMQDSVENIDDTVPGINRIPLIGWLFAQQKNVNRKTELVIFLRATVIRDASIEGDYRGFRELLPGTDFLRKPNPGRAEAAESPASR